MATIVDQETDARFAAQTGYRVGQKLDPKDPTDAKMIPVWLDIQRKVKAEAAAGKLVTTFDHPVVAQNLADAHAADQAAAVHLDAAAATPDPAVAQQHVTAAQAATAVSAQKTREAATIQLPTVSLQLVKEAAQGAAQEPPHPSAPASDHIANAQAQAAHKPTPQGALEKETDARFWAQLHYKPGQKLDPKDPTDAKMIPVWIDIYGKVKREDDAGKLVLTYNSPIVAQNLADAHVADQAAALHLDTAAATPDLHTAQQNIAAASTAAQISAQKAREAARLQPPTVSPQLAHEAAQKSDERQILKTTDELFWSRTRYKPGQRLDPRNPQDARMIPIWMSLYEQVKRAQLAGTVAQQPPTGRNQLAQEQAKGAGRRAVDVHYDHRHRRPVKSTVPPSSIQDYRAGATQIAHGTGAPFVIVTQHPDGTPDHRALGSRAELDAEYAKISDQHDQYKYVAAFDLAADPNAPVHDSVGIPAAEHVETPAPVVAPTEGAPSAPEAALTEAVPTEKPKASVGKIVAIVAAVAAAGGLVYVATRKPTRKPSSPGVSRTPKVLVATPASTSSAIPARLLRAR